jgi:hypothetical protein
VQPLDFFVLVIMSHMLTLHLVSKGNLTMLDFLKSADRVYKEYRLLQASIQNSSRIDQSLEKICNWIFYIVVLTIILATLGL